MSLRLVAFHSDLCRIRGPCSPHPPRASPCTCPGRPRPSTRARRCSRHSSGTRRRPRAGGRTCPSHTRAPRYTMPSCHMPSLPPVAPGRFPPRTTRRRRRPGGVGRPPPRSPSMLDRLRSAQRWPIAPGGWHTAPPPSCEGAQARSSLQSTEKLGQGCPSGWVPSRIPVAREVGEEGVGLARPRRRAFSRSISVHFAAASWSKLAPGKASAAERSRTHRVCGGA